MKKFLASILVLVMVLSTMNFVAFADEPASEAVASVKVGTVTTEYEDIGEALTAWTNGTTLTLLSDVTLPNVYKFKSTESRTLNLGKYTMTAASGQHAIEIECNGQPKATYGLIINADSQNPGGITAAGKSCIYYRKSGTTQDRVLIQINGGVFNGSYAVNVYSSNRGTNCPQVNIAGGTFNGNVNIGHGKLMASGGTFNGWVNCTGDSTAYRQISGGTYKSWQFMTADATNKFWVGTSQANYNIGVYVDDNGYLVVGGPVITENNGNFGAHTTYYSAWSSYLKYSSAAANGLYYENADTAISKSKSGTVTLYEDSDAKATVSGTLTIDCTSGAQYSGEVKLNSRDSTLKVILPKGDEFQGTVVQYDSSRYIVATKDTSDDDSDVITYTQITDPAAAGKEAALISGASNIAYDFFDDAISDAAQGDTVKLLKDIVYYNINTQSNVALLAAGDPIVVDLNGNTLSPADPTIPTFVNGEKYIIKNGTIEGDVVNNGGDLVIENLEIKGDLVINAGTADMTSGTLYGVIETADEDSLDILGGKFFEDPTAYVPEEYDVIRHSGYYVVTDLSAEAKSISVEFQKTDIANGEDNLEGTDTYNIVLKANDGDKINELASADLTFLFDGTPVDGGAMSYSIEHAEGIAISQTGKPEDKDRYMFNYDGVTNYEGNGTDIIIATLTIDGYGTYSFRTVDADTNIVNATTVNDNLVDYYIKDGDTDDKAETGGLVINKDTNTSDDFIGSINATITVPTRDLEVNVAFPNAVENQTIAYQDMKVVIFGSDLKEDITIDLGSDAIETPLTIANKKDASYKAEFVDGAYKINVSKALTKDRAYTVTVEGAGYRTARCTVTMTNDKTLNFWNNVEDVAKVIETDATSGEVTKNFLAGDIVKDNNINIYDLSAVVSYFGKATDKVNKSDYAKYDLNRDGVVDSKDVAYVLVSWNE